MKKLKNFFSWLFKGEDCSLYCACGHRTKMKKDIEVKGHKVTLYVKYHPFKDVPYCLDCLEKMTITCPWCGRPIFVGDYVTLYTPTDKNFKIPEGTIVYTKDPLRLVGCQHPDCAFSGADYSGIWEAPGSVKRIPSAIERVMMTGNPVIVNF